MPSRALCRPLPFLSCGVRQQSILKQDYKEDCSLADAMALSVKVLLKTMDSTTLTAEKLEMARLTRTDAGKVVFHVLSSEEVAAFLLTQNLGPKKDAA